jgi:5'-3' exonuclease
MGVPRFFSWVNNNYTVIIDPITKPNEFYFDLNCLLHPKCFEVAGEILKENPDYDLIKNQDKLETKMFNRIIEYMEEILDYIQPTDLIYIAIDGVAPMAKMKHQRLRRFKSVKEQEIRNQIFIIHKDSMKRFDQLYHMLRSNPHLGYQFHLRSWSNYIFCSLITKLWVSAWATVVYKAASRILNFSKDFANR